MIKGVDVSKWQGRVDWKAKALQGFNFAVAKATEGTDIVDAYFADNAAGIPAAGLIGGAYHFFHPAQDPREQAQHFLSTIAGADGLKLPVMLDWEVSDGMRISTQVTNAQIWLDAVAQATGKAPFVYSYLAYFEQLALPESFAQYPLWLAAYSAHMPQPPAPWNTITIWQSSGSGGLDIDQFNGDMAQLEKFTA